MKTTLLALVLAGLCSAASAQSIRLNRACGSGFGVFYAGNGFSFSFGTAYPPVVPVGYHCPPPVYLSPCAYPARTPVYSYRPVRAVVADPVFSVRRYWR